MKHLKQKLFAAIAMLTVAATMMASSTYAWFAISTAPTVTGVETTVKANESFEIAAKDEAPGESAVGDAATGNSTWGNTVTFATSDFTGATLGPATPSGASLVTATYDATGRVDTDTGTITWAAANSAGVSIGTDAEGNAIAFKLPLWLRSNVGGSTTLTVAAPTTTLTDSSLIKMAISLGGADLAVVSCDGTANTIGTLTANTATSATLYVYLDGPNTHNDDVAEAVSVAFSSIQFGIAAVDGNDSYTLT